MSSAEQLALTQMAWGMPCQCCSVGAAKKGYVVEFQHAVGKAFDGTELF